MNIPAALLACSLHPDDLVVRAIVDNAHDNVFSVVSPDVDPETAAAALPVRSLEAALAQVHELEAQGAQPLLGLMQVPIDWAASFGRESRELFDPCINISIGTAMLSAFDFACASKASGHGRTTSPAAVLRARRSCAVHRYAEAVRMPELADVVSLSLRAQQRASTLVLADDAPLFAGAQPPWRSDREATALAKRARYLAKSHVMDARLRGAIGVIRQNSETRSRGRDSR